MLGPAGVTDCSGAVSSPLERLPRGEAVRVTLGAAQALQG